MKKTLNIDGVSVYHSYPDDEEKHPAIILIEEIWGLNEHIKNVCDRFAGEGYSVISPELLPKGLLDMITPNLQEDMFNPEKRDEVQPKIRAAMAPIQQHEFAEETIKKLKSCVDYLINDEHTNGNVAVMGFCFGGTYSYHLAGHDRRIKAAVPFYGHAPSDEEIENIEAPILAFYGEEDVNLMDDLPKLKEKMQSQNKKFEAIVYPEAGHAFFNDTNHRQYRALAANDAWNKTLVFLKHCLQYRNGK